MDYESDSQWYYFSLHLSINEGGLVVDLNFEHFTSLHPLSDKGFESYNTTI